MNWLLALPFAALVMAAFFSLVILAQAVKDKDEKCIVASGFAFGLFISLSISYFIKIIW